MVVGAGDAWKTPFKGKNTRKQPQLIERFESYTSNICFELHTCALDNIFTLLFSIEIFKFGFFLARMTCMGGRFRCHWLVPIGSKGYFTRSVWDGKYILIKLIATWANPNLIQTIYCDIRYKQAR